MSKPALSKPAPLTVGTAEGDAKRQKVGGPAVSVTGATPSPRLRTSLSNGGSLGGFDGAHPSAKAVAAAAAAAQRGAASEATAGGAGGALGLAPRCAGARLAEVREEFEMTVPQFAEQARLVRPGRWPQPQRALLRPGPAR